MAYIFEVPSLNETYEDKTKLKTLSYDYEKQEFNVNSKGEIGVDDYIEAFKLWCKKALSIIRYSKLAYSNNLGIEIDPVNIYDSRQAKENWVMRTVTETVMSDPEGRAKSVDKFEFEYPEPDLMLVTFTITPKVGEPFDLGKEI